MYYDRDSDIYLSYDSYLEYDKISPSQQKQMDLGPLGDPKSREYNNGENQEEFFQRTQEGPVKE